MPPLWCGRRDTKTKRISLFALLLLRPLEKLTQGQIARKTSTSSVAEAESDFHRSWPSSQPNIGRTTTVQTKLRATVAVEMAKQSKSSHLSIVTVSIDSESNVQTMTKQIRE